jgi:hypothetical protein
MCGELSFETKVAERDNPVLQQAAREDRSQAQTAREEADAERD